MHTKLQSDLEQFVLVDVCGLVAISFVKPLGHPAIKWKLWKRLIKIYLVQALNCFSSLIFCNNCKKNYHD